MLTRNACSFHDMHVMHPHTMCLCHGCGDIMCCRQRTCESSCSTAREMSEASTPSPSVLATPVITAFCFCAVNGTTCALLAQLADTTSQATCGVSADMK